MTSNAIHVNRLVALLMPAMFFMMNLTSVLILWFGAVRIDAGAMYVGAMMASLQYAIQILFAVFMVTAVFVMLPRAAASAERINAVLDVVPDVVDPLNVGPGFLTAEASAKAVSRTGHHAETIGRVEFQNVTFQYPGAQEPAVSDVSFTALPGEVTAIIGGTGSGKSTLAGLIPRLYDVNAGRLLVDGVDVRDMRQAGLRARIGYVPQKAVLFTGTVASNIRFGHDEATDDEMRHAASVAQADHFIRTLPDNYGTVINEEATNLSQGQKQLLTIARAFLADPAILVLDEATSSVDTRTEVLIQEAMGRLMKGRTTFVIAHRLSTIRNADVILMMAHGRIVEKGTHQALLDAGGRYAELYQSQFMGAVS